MLEALVSGKVQICLCSVGSMLAAAAAACILLRIWQSALMGFSTVHVSILLAWIFSNCGTD